MRTNLEFNETPMTFSRQEENRPFTYNRSVPVALPDSSETGEANKSMQPDHTNEHDREPQDEFREEYPNDLVNIDNEPHLDAPLSQSVQGEFSVKLQCQSLF